MRIVVALGWIGLVLMSVDVRASGDQSNASSCDAQRAAVAAAVAFVRNHSGQGEYDLKRPNAENWGDEWTVSFARLDHVVPAHGLVTIQKTDCSGAWVPLK
jgi:hypothetical protein